MKRPSAPLVVARPSSTSATWTPATGAPLESLTRPLSVSGGAARAGAAASRPSSSVRSSDAARMLRTMATGSAPRDDHRTAVFAGFLGWTLDAFDFFLVVMTLTAIAQEFHQSDAAIAFSITLTLAFRPVGAFVFGLLADRYGRKLPLMIDLVFYSVVEVLTGFAP